MTEQATDDQVTAVRAFNRLYTNVIGVLRDGYLGTPYSLTEARILFELGQRDSTEVAGLRRGLDIDAGYLSRILARFEADRLITKRRSDSDGRRQIIALTDAGRALQAELDAQAASQIGALLATVDEPARRRVISCMQEITSAFTGGSRPQAYVLRAPRPGDMGWVVQRQAAGYAREFGWDETYESLIARLVADYVDHRDPAREAAWIAEVDGEPAGSVFCLRKDDTTAQLRMLFVEPWARGLGIGSRLVDECLRFARSAGYTDIMLWTNSILAGARRIYERAGFTLVDEEKHHSFGHDLVGQNWSRPL
jgi:DNA-binding MarR family transcriptional regulator/GNAT superfamily N-acetyltransferase